MTAVQFKVSTEDAVGHRPYVLAVGLLAVFHKTYFGHCGLDVGPKSIPLPDSHNLYQTHATFTRLTKPLPDSHNLYQAYTTSTRFRKPLLDSCNLTPHSCNLNKSHVTSNIPTQSLPDSHNL